MFMQSYATLKSTFSLVKDVVQDHTTPTMCVKTGLKWGLCAITMYRFVGPTVYYLIRSNYVDRKLDLISSQLCSRSVTQYNPDMRRQIQSAMAVPQHGPMRPGHPHEEMAKCRNAATMAMHAIAVSLGCRRYVISPSDREKGVDGARCFYTAADLTQQVKDDPVTEDHVIITTDVDYFIDMPAWISHGRPILSYTFSPTTVSGEVSEGFFTIKDNEVTFRVAGGKTVTHGVWNYNQDYVMSEVEPVGWVEFIANAMHKTIFGTPIWAMVSSVDTWTVGEHRRVVAIVPTARMLSFFARRKTGTWLKKINFKHGQFNVIKTYDSGETQISIAHEGDTACVTMPLVKYECARIAHEHAGRNKHLSDTTRRSKLGDLSPVLHQFFLQELGGVDYTEIYVGKEAPHYTVLTGTQPFEEICDERKTYARTFAPPPIGNTAAFPHENVTNAKASIEGRITKPQNNKPTWRSTHDEWAVEFVERILTFNGDVRGTGHPMDVSEVHDIQARPMQRLRSGQRTLDAEEPMLVKAFQKREAYGTANDPRTISSMPILHTLNVSSYTLQMKKQVLMALPFYIPGKTPLQISESLMDLAADHTNLVQTDFSRFDGHINKQLRQRVEFAVYLGWVHRDYRETLSRLLHAELNPKSVHGSIKYEAGCSRLSGSPLTSDGNTIINAFVQYATGRHYGLKPVDAFSAIGLICGDDAVVPKMNIGATGRILVARQLGLTLKVDKESKTGEPVTFLSRVFTDPWTTPASIQEPVRTLLKLHTTVDTESTIESAGVAKAQGYLVTDALSPIVGAWCRCYLRNVDGDHAVSTTNRDLPYYAREEFLTEPWPQDYGRDDIVADALGVSASIVAGYTDALEQYTGPIEGIPSMRLPPMPQKIDALLDNQIQQAGPSTNDSTSINNVTAKPTPSVCKRLLPPSGSSSGPHGGTSMAPRPDDGAATPSTVALHPDGGSNARIKASSPQHVQPAHEPPPHSPPPGHGRPNHHQGGWWHNRRDNSTWRGRGGRGRGARGGQRGAHRQC